MKRVRFFTSVKSLITENCHACVFCSGATQIPHHATLEKQRLCIPSHPSFFEQPFRLSAFFFFVYFADKKPLRSGFPRRRGFEQRKVYTGGLSSTLHTIPAAAHTKHTTARSRNSGFPAEPSTSESAAAFRARLDPLQEAVRGRWPAAHLTAAVTLALAGLSDGPLAPLEAAAEEAGGDPARLYTVEQLGQAFLAVCDEEKLAAFDPLFEPGEGRGGALAARAALQPKVYLQALVRRALL